MTFHHLTNIAMIVGCEMSPFPFVEMAHNAESLCLIKVIHSC
jgi:hypothetical protein